MSQYTLSLFGSAHLERDGVVLRLRSRKAIALLAYLAVTGVSHSRATLSALFWPEADAKQARDRLRYTLWVLRKALNGRWLVADRSRIGLDGSEKTGVDVVRFRCLLAARWLHGHLADEERGACLGQLTQAITLYSGDFMAGFTLADSPAFDDWQSLETAALRRECGNALDWLAAGYAAEGNVKRGIGYAQRWLALDPLHEPAHRCLMRLYAQSGRRSEALVQFEVCAELLEEQLGVAPDPETTALSEAIREGRVGPRRTTDIELPRALHNLPPQPTPFVGRETELSQIAGLLANPACRLLSVVGPGGMGKSRLAIRAARDQTQRFTDGVVFVPLGPVGSPELLASAMMEALGAPSYGGMDPEAQLVNVLREKNLLLVLDSFEHLLEGTTLVARILGAAPLAKVLVTSRERLNLRGEWLMVLEGMQFPDEAEIPVAKEEDYSALRLFVSCARRVRQGLSLDSAGLGSVARICRLVEGMPLAIELAAPWVQSMSCDDILRGIEGNLDLLTTELRDIPERHRSMRAVFDQSWMLLSAGERRVLEQLSVFRGGFLREAAEAVAVQSSSLPETLLTLSSLLRQSWLRFTPSGRYEMHELVRQYCAERSQAELADEGVLGDKGARDRHSRYYSAFLAEREGRLHGRGQKEALEEILGEMDNVWAAWYWAVDQGQVDVIGDCVEALAHVCGVRGRYHEVHHALQEGAAMLGRRLDAYSSQGEGPARNQAAVVLANLLSKQASMCETLGRFQRGIKLSRQAIALLRDVDPGIERDRARLSARVALGGLLWISGDGDQGARLLREALILADEIGDPWRKERVLFELGTCLRNVGQYSEAEDLLEQAIAIADDTGEQWVKAASMDSLSWVQWAQGRYKRAENLAEGGLGIFRELGAQGQICSSWSRLGHIATVMGRYDLARQHLGNGLALARSIGHSVIENECLLGQADLAFALGEYEEARRLSEESLACARASSSPVAEAISLVHLGQAVCALGEAEMARSHFCESLDIATTAGAAFAALDCLMELAYLSTGEGDPKRTVELLALVMHHPTTRKVSRDRARDLLSELESELPTEVFAAAVAWGRDRELAEVTAEVLARDGGLHS